MSSVLVETAEAVVTALNSAAAGTFSQRFQAERSYADWELPLEESAPADRVLVDVVPVPPMAIDAETRGDVAYQPAVDMIVRKRLTPDQRDGDGKLLLPEVDSLVLFVEELSEFHMLEELSNGARWKETEIRRSHVPAHLRQFSQFTGIVRVTFDYGKGLAA